MGKKENSSLSQSKQHELKILSDKILVKSREQFADNNALEHFIDIYDLLEKMRKIQSESKITIKTSRTDESIRNFIQWSKDYGCNLSKVDIKLISEVDGLGLVNESN
jgi:hypothetical protein